MGSRFRKYSTNFRPSEFAFREPGSTRIPGTWSAVRAASVDRFPRVPADVTRYAARFLSFSARLPRYPRLMSALRPRFDRTPGPVRYPVWFADLPFLFPSRPSPFAIVEPRQTPSRPPHRVSAEKEFFGRRSARFSAVSRRRARSARPGLSTADGERNVGRPAPAVVDFRRGNMESASYYNFFVQYDPNARESTGRRQWPW